MDNVLKVENITKSYKKNDVFIDVLNKVSFNINSSEMVSIVGTSGSGKSTLLHILGTLDKPDSGHVFYNNKNLQNLSESQLADFRNQELGFVFQFHHLLPEFTALENVMMPALVGRIDRKKSTSLAKDKLEEVGLGERMQHKPSELSGGEQQRVALARALVLKPSLLLADEVTGNLDQKTSEKIHDLLFELNRNYKMTVILVTHNNILASKMSRKFILENGIIKEQG